MSNQLGFYIESDRCVQCHACQVACKSVNNVELGVTWRRVVGVWNGTFPKATFKTISLACMHCADPACQAVCPTGAITKRAQDGIVVVDQNKCIGCKFCLSACPFGAPQFGVSGKMQKCNLCVDRLAAGKQPACVQTCPANALHVGTLDELSKMGQKKSAVKLAGQTLPSVFIAK